MRVSAKYERGDKNGNVTKFYIAGTNQKLNLPIFAIA